MKAPVKTLEEKSLDKNAPATPIPHATADNAWRVEMNLRRAVGAAKDLLASRNNGEQISVGGHSIEGLSRLDRSRVFAILWPAVLSRITYWEHHARRYVELSKDLEREMQSVRLQIDELQNA